MTTNTISRPATSRIWLAALVAALIAVAVNLLIWLLAGAVGIPLQIQIGGPQSPAEPLTAGPIIVMSVVPALLAAGLLWLLRRMSSRSWTIFLGIAVVMLLLSLAGPLMLQVPTANKLVLALMHVVTAGVIVGTLRRMQSEA